MSNRYESITLWRYMDLLKFIDLVEGERLHFSPIISFKDQFEGIFEGIDSLFLENIIYELDTPELRREEIEEKLYNMYRELRDNILVSCWNINDQESLVMWEIYTKGIGVAIKTTENKLKSVLNHSNVGKLYFGKVTYTDDLKLHTLKNHEILFKKRKIFEYENEYRVIAYKRHLEDNYIYIDLKQLIEEVYISPDAPNWAKETVELTLKNHGLTEIEVIKKDYFTYLGK